MSLLDRETFLTLAQDEIESLLLKNGFENPEFLSRDQDGENDIIFVYDVFEVELSRRWKVSTHVNFENYNEDLNFSNIYLSAYITANGGDLFLEGAESLKESYLQLQTSLEKDIIKKSLNENSPTIQIKKRI